jgi:hypothetical protein
MINFTPTGVEQPAEPAPDILMECDKQRRGIEIARHMRQCNRQHESEQQQIVRMAQREYKASGNPAVGVSIHWFKQQPRARVNRDAVSRALSAIVANNVPQFGTWNDLDSLSLPESLSSMVDYVRIDRVVDYRQSDWRIPRSGWFPPVQPQDIRSAISKKEPYFDGYRQYCDFVWLLIVSEGDGPSSWCEIPPETREQCYSTRFTRVFFLASRPRELIEFSLS